MWSDPDEVENWAVSPRGAGWLFGGRVTQEFNHFNSLKLIARAHQLVQEGYKFMFDKQLVTVWSAPNYCYRCGNLASILKIREDGGHDFKVYDAAPENERDKGMQKTKRTVRAKLLAKVHALNLLSCRSGEHALLCVASLTPSITQFSAPVFPWRSVSKDRRPLTYIHDYNLQLSPVNDICTPSAGVFDEIVVDNSWKAITCATSSPYLRECPSTVCSPYLPKQL